jgi:hypothetical protein
MMGRTGKAPPVGPPGSFGGGGVSLDTALVAVVGVGAPLCDTAPATAPHPTIKTNKPAPARNAIAVLPVFITTPTVHPHKPKPHRMGLRFKCVIGAGQCVMNMVG